MSGIYNQLEKDLVPLLTQCEAVLRQAATELERQDGVIRQASTETVKPVLAEADVRRMCEGLAAKHLAKTADIDSAVSAIVSDPNALFGVIDKLADRAVAKTASAEAGDVGSLQPVRKLDRASRSGEPSRMEQLGARLGSMSGGN